MAPAGFDRKRGRGRRQLDAKKGAGSGWRVETFGFTVWGWLRASRINLIGVEYL